MPSILEQVATAALVSVFVAVAWLVWDNAGMVVRGTFFNEFRHIIGLLAVIAVLSLMQMIVDQVRKRMTPR